MQRHGRWETRSRSGGSKGHQAEETNEFSCTTATNPTKGGKTDPIWFNTRKGRGTTDFPLKAKHKSSRLKPKEKDFKVRKTVNAKQRRGSTECWSNVKRRPKILHRALEGGFRHNLDMGRNRQKKKTAARKRGFIRQRRYGGGR